MNKRSVHLLLSALVTGLGLVLAVGKIIFDSEPGLIPLLLVAAGIVWHVTARRRFPPRMRK